MAIERMGSSRRKTDFAMVYRPENGATLAIFDSGKLGRLQANLVAAASRFAGINVEIKRIMRGEEYGEWGASDEGARVFSYTFGVNDGEFGSLRIPAQDRLTASHGVWMD